MQKYRTDAAVNTSNYRTVNPALWLAHSNLTYGNKNSYVDITDTMTCNAIVMVSGAVCLLLLRVVDREHILVNPVPDHPTATNHETIPKTPNSAGTPLMKNVAIRACRRRRSGRASWNVLEDECCLAVGVSSDHCDKSYYNTEDLDFVKQVGNTLFHQFMYLVYCVEMSCE